MKVQKVVTKWKLEIEGLELVKKTLSEIQEKQSNIKNEMKEIEELMNKINSIDIRLKKEG